jgi:hypothetical protein
MVFKKKRFFSFKIFPISFKELAGLAEQEFGMDSNAMFNDLHAPSVPVQPLDAGHASATTKVRIYI